MSSISQSPRYAAIVVAAGTGSRMGEGPPKQHRKVGGKTLMRYSLDAFAAHPDCTQIILVISEEDLEKAAMAISGLENISLVIGGDSRRQSVRNGLEALANRTDTPPLVLIHDAARPGLSGPIIDRLLKQLESYEGALPVLPVTDSVARSDGALLSESVDRTGLVRIQTPQAFRFDAIFDAHRDWPQHKEATDDARMLMAIGKQVAHVEGSEWLRKITYADDLRDYENMLGRGSMNMRIGKGYDVHRLQKGEKLWLCGVQIDHSHGLAGHSDADVAIHALVDALFGALGEGDIGTHFPPSDDKWRGVASKTFLAEAMSRVRARGFALANCDLTIICEAPKIGPHREAMRDTLAGIMKVERECISVKATTTEGLGFTGRGEGIAAEAIVLLTER